MKSTPKLAVLLTCHNRKDKTLACLKALYEQSGLGMDYLIDVFLVDDGSNDGTSLAVKNEYSLVNIIQGDGNLYWNQGMRLAWKIASETNDYDFYFWLNDDTILDSDGLLNLLKNYNQATKQEQNEVIITAACRTKIGNDIFSYGGRDEKGAVEPNGIPQVCKYINGNAVLVSRAIYKKLGNLSNDYTHGMGDFDYGLRALKDNFGCYTTGTYLATCAPNEGIPGWCNPNLSIKKRWELMHSPRGLNIREYIKFRKKFWGIYWMSFAFKAYAKMLSPKLYQKIS